MEKGERLSPPQEPQGTLGQTERSLISKQTPSNRLREFAETGIKHRGKRRKKLPGAGRDFKVFAVIRNPPNSCWIKCKPEGKHLSAGKQWAREALFICIKILYVKIHK